MTQFYIHSFYVDPDNIWIKYLQNKSSHRKKESFTILPLLNESKIKSWVERENVTECIIFPAFPAQQVLQPERLVSDWRSGTEGGNGGGSSWCTVCTVIVSTIVQVHDGVYSTAVKVLLSCVLTLYTVHCSRCRVYIYYSVQWQDTSYQYFHYNTVYIINTL